MKKINEVKKLFDKFEMKEYDKRFSHKQMKFVCSKIALVFNEKILIEDLYAIEKSVLEAKLDSDLFKDAFNKIDKLVNNGADWASLGKYMWFVYHTSIFYKSKNKVLQNIYTKENSVELNEIRRDLYAKWMHSLDKEDIKFNENIMAVARLTM